MKVRIGRGGPFVAKRLRRCSNGRQSGCGRGSHCGCYGRRLGARWGWCLLLGEVLVVWDDDVHSEHDESAREDQTQEKETY